MIHRVAIGIPAEFIAAKLSGWIYKPNPESNSMFELSPTLAKELKS
jgi:hypothetical protein